jgi:hypothetical protein
VDEFRAEPARWDDHDSPLRTRLADAARSAEAGRRRTKTRATLRKRRQTALPHRQAPRATATHGPCKSLETGLDEPIC